MASGAPTKKLINEVSACVQESLAGVALRHDEVAVLEGYPIVVRRQLLTGSLRDVGKHVALIAGGGSGHEPAFAGMVGRGGLSAAVSGGIFASPPSDYVLASLMAARRSAGVLLLVINYTGDRLNFGIAVERAKQQLPDLNVHTVVFGDDCALQSADRSAGRRGLAGSLMLIKICGAMAEAGMPLSEIANTAQKIADNCGTIGLSLSSCSPPGRGALFEMPENQMELGLGIHGEPGVRRVDMANAKQVVDMALCHMTNPTSTTCFHLCADDNVALLLNNLGSTSQLEMNILTYEVIRWLKRKKLVNVCRVFVGTCMTSLDMHGFSVSLLRLVNDDWLQFLDASHRCPAWPLGTTAVGDASELVLQMTEEISLSAIRDNVQLDTEMANKMTAALLAACQAVVDNEAQINDLDSACGDGDCGSTLKVAAEQLKSAQENDGLTATCPAAFFSAISRIFEQKVGGTAGALYALFFNSVGSQLRQSVDRKQWLKAFEEGTKTVMQYGKAKRGDRTLVDTLLAVVDVMQLVSVDQSPLDRKWYDDVIQQAENAAIKTTHMTAYAGRASYVARQNLTKPDAGAYAVYLIVKAVLNSIS